MWEGRVRSGACGESHVLNVGTGGAVNQRKLGCSCHSAVNLSMNYVTAGWWIDRRLKREEGGAACLVASVLPELLSCVLAAHSQMG